MRAGGDAAFMSQVAKQIAILAVGIALFGSGVGARAADDPAVNRGTQFLRSRAAGMQVGESAMIALALIKAEIPLTDPVIGGLVTKIRQRFDSTGYNPERAGGYDVYEAGVVAMALANLESESRRHELEQVAQFLIGKQKANGSWDYDNRSGGDTSISQYAVLGLWEADNAGARVTPAVWDRAAQWYLSSQAAGGSWSYHRDESNYPETISMTAAGVGSLLICKRQITKYSKGVERPSALLTQLNPTATSEPYEFKTTPGRIDQAVNRGLAWLGASFTTKSDPIIGPSVYYGLYGIERIGALAEKTTLGRIDWFDQGGKFIRTSQRADGSWTSAHGDEMNTVWAILFLQKSTAKSLRRIEIKRLGAGTLLGGRGLPRDLSTMTVAGGRVVSRPMNGAVEGMLAVLEDPRAATADAALSGLVSRFETEGPRVLRPHRDRFRKLITNPDPGLRKVAAWALGRLGELDVAPALINALEDPDEQVVETARLGLQLLSRKIVGLGPPSPSTPEERRAAAARWRAWYETIRPLELEGQGDDDTAAPTAGAPAAPRSAR